MSVSLLIPLKYSSYTRSNSILFTDCGLHIYSITPSIIDLIRCIISCSYLTRLLLWRCEIRQHPTCSAGADGAGHWVNSQVTLACLWGVKYVLMTCPPPLSLKCFAFCASCNRSSSLRITWLPVHLVWSCCTSALFWYGHWCRKNTLSHDIVVSSGHLVG